MYVRSLMPTFSRIRREIEPRWVAEYCVKFYPNYPVRYRCPLGPIPEQLEEMYGVGKGKRVFRPWRPEVDALIILPDRLILVEGKVFKYMDGVSKLPVYKSLVPQTPELKPYWHLPIEMHFLIVKELAWVKEAAERMGVKLIAWAPVWVQEIWLERNKYWTKEMVELRERRKEVLRRLGFT